MIYIVEKGRLTELPLLYWIATVLEGLSGEYHFVAVGPVLLMKSSILQKGLPALSLLFLDKI